MVRAPRSVRLPLACLGSAVLVAACGSGAASGPSPSGPSPTATSSPAASATPTATPSPSPAPSSGGVQFMGTVAITGSVSDSGTFDDTLDGEDAVGHPYASCTDWASDLINGQPDTGVVFSLPSPQAIPGPQGPTPPAGTIEQVQLLLDGTWPGPGAYGNGSGQSAAGLTEHASIIVEGSSGPDNFIDPATWEVDVASDGSGLIIFSGAQGTSGTVGTVSGSVDWTCS